MTWHSFECQNVLKRFMYAICQFGMKRVTIINYVQFASRKKKRIRILMITITQLNIDYHINNITTNQWIIYENIRAGCRDLWPCKFCKEKNKSKLLKCWRLRPAPFEERSTQKKKTNTWRWQRRLQQQQRSHRRWVLFNVKCVFIDYE